MLDKITEQITKIDEKNRYFILGGILLLIFLVNYFVVMTPLLKTLSAINPKIKQFAEDLKNARTEGGKVGQYSSEINKLNEQLKKSSQRVITKEEINWVLGQISRMAHEERIKIDQIMPIKGSETVLLNNKEGKYYSLPIMVNARCGYHDMGRFLNRVEQGDVFLSLSDFSFSGSGEDTGRNIAKLTFRAVIFEKTEGSESK